MPVSLDEGKGEKLFNGLLKQAEERHFHNTINPANSNYIFCQNTHQYLSQLFS